MGWKFNPFTGALDQTGSGGGGSSYIDGEVATYNDLPLDGTAALNSAWLVREASGIWPVSRKQAGIYIRTATAGSSRDADYTYAGTMPDVFSDAVFTLYDDASTTRTGQFNLGSVTAGQNRVLTWPDGNGTIARTSDIPAAFDPASPGTIGGTTPAAATFTNLTANTRVNLPNTNGTTAGDLYRNANTLRYRDSTNAERLLLNATDNLSNLANTATARTNLGITVGATDNAVVRADGTNSNTMQGSDLVIDDYTSSTQGNIAIAPRSVSFSCTATASDDFVTATGHTFANGDQVTFTSLTGGGGLSTNVRYFVRDSEANRFKVATTSTGSAINITTDATAGTVQLVTALVLTPRNIGAFVLGPKPDGTAAGGGNARGRYAVDLQMFRTDTNDAAAVASGNLSFLLGANSRTTAERSGGFGIWNTTVSGFGAMALGCIDSTINGTFSVGIGHNVNTRSRYGIVAYGTQFFQACTIFAQLTGRTTTNSAVELSLDGTNTVTRLTIPSGFIHHYFIVITGVRSTGATSAHYIRQYAIKNVGGTTSEVFAPATIGTDTAASTSISITANDTDDALKIDCTGIASETWRWHAMVWCTEMQYGT